MDGAEHHINWNSQLTKLLAKEGERIAGLRWLHERAERYCSTRNTFVALPVIILSTLSGSASIGTDDPTMKYLIGSISLFVGILNTFGSFFAFAKRQEAHRVSALQLGKLARFIEIELALPRNERIAAKDILKIVRESVDRISETAPSIPPHVIKDFQTQFHGSEIAVPTIANGIDKVEIYEEVHAEPSPVKRPSVKISFEPPAPGQKSTIVL